MVRMVKERKAWLVIREPTLVAKNNVALLLEIRTNSFQFLANVLNPSIISLSLSYTYNTHTHTPVVAYNTKM
jgi:hypothetical protein